MQRDSRPEHHVSCSDRRVLHPSGDFPLITPDPTWHMPCRNFLPWLFILVSLAGVPGCISSETVASSLDTAPATDVLLARARAASLQGDHIAAEQILRKLLQQDRDHLEARIALADVYCHLARERGAPVAYEPPAAIAQLKYAAERKPDDIVLARRLMFAYLETGDIYSLRLWALKVAQLDKQAPVATEIVIEALFERENWKLGEPLLRRLSRMPSVRPLVILNLWVELARSRNNLSEIQDQLADYLQAVSCRTHLDWGGIPSEDIPRLFTVLEAAVESGSSIQIREDRLSQAITIVKRLMQTEIGLAFSNRILNQAAQLIQKTDLWNQAEEIPAADRTRVSQQRHASRRRFWETASQLPDDIVLQPETLEQIRIIGENLQSD